MAKNEKVNAVIPGAELKPEPAGMVDKNVTVPKEEKVIEKKKNIVEVDKDMLQKLLDKVDAQGEKIADLTQAADLGRLGRIQEARNKGKLAKTARVALFDKHYVLGWRTVEDDVFIDQEGKLKETQIIELVLDNGEGAETTRSRKMSQQEFSRLISSVSGEVVKESRDEDGQVFQTILLPDGRKLELSIVFLNK